MAIHDYIPEKFVDPDDDYTQSLIPVKPQVLFAIVILAFIFSVGLLSNVLPDFFGVFIFLVCFAGLFLGLRNYSRRPTKFETKYNFIQKFDASLSIDNFHGPLGKVLIYKEGIEVRFFFKSYFVPYEKIISLNSKKSLIANEIKIEINFKSLPKKINISSSENEAILSHISDSISCNNIGFNTRAPDEKEKYSRLKSVFKFQEKEIYYNKRIVTGLLLLEFFLAFSIGPLTIFVKKLTFKPTEYCRLFNKSEYMPVDELSAPDHYTLVEVRYNKNHEITSEIYYILNGEIQSIQIVNGSYKSSRSNILSSYIFVLFGILGFILTAAGMQVKETIAIYGITMFIGTIVIGMIHWVITIIFFPFW